MTTRAVVAFVASFGLILFTNCGNERGVTGAGGQGMPPGDDAGPPDAGRDAGADAGPDAGADAGNDDASFPPNACVELGQIDIWSPVPGNITLPHDLGRILACEHTLSVPALGSANGYEEYAIQYVSQGPIGTAHRVTALLYLPSDGKSDYPIVAVNHGTSGMGPSCGPTHETVAADYMALPLVTAGYAVVATDYAGMGVDEGVPAAYAVGDSEAYSVLDGVRALLGFHDSRFDAKQLGTNLFLMGHSQGGQANLFAHGLFATAPGGPLGLDLLGSVSFAPAFGDVREFASTMSATTTTIGVGTLAAMALYGQYIYYGVPNLTTWLTTSAAAQLPSILHDQCIETETVAIPADWPTFGDMLTPSFLATASGCALDGGTCPAFAPWADELLAIEPGDFASPAPALILQGEVDTLVYPETTACIVKRLEKKGTPVQACGYALADHITVVPAAMGNALTWMTGRLAGLTPNVCPATLAETCNP